MMFVEVVVGQCEFFQFFGEVEEWVCDVQGGEYFVCGVFDEFGVWVVVFVYLVFEVYQFYVFFFVFYLFDEVGDVLVGVVDLIEYGQYGFIGVVVEWFGQGLDVGGD